MLRKKKGRRRALERSGVWRNGREKKKEERRIKKKKRVRVRVWSRKKEGKKKCRVWRIKKDGKKRKKEDENVITIFS